MSLSSIRVQGVVARATTGVANRLLCPPRRTVDRLSPSVERRAIWRNRFQCVDSLVAFLTLEISRSAPRLCTVADPDDSDRRPLSSPTLSDLARTSAASAKLRRICRVHRR